MGLKSVAYNNVWYGVCLKGVCACTFFTCYSFHGWLITTCHSRMNSTPWSWSYWLGFLIWALSGALCWYSLKVGNNCALEPVVLHWRMTMKCFCLFSIFPHHYCLCQDIITSFLLPSLVMTMCALYFFCSALYCDGYRDDNSNNTWMEHLMLIITPCYHLYTSSIVCLILSLPSTAVNHFLHAIWWRL